MKIIADPKEIAALVLALQERRDVETCSTGEDLELRNDPAVAEKIRDCLKATRDIFEGTRKEQS